MDHIDFRKIYPRDDPNPSAGRIRKLCGCVITALRARAGLSAEESCRNELERLLAVAEEGLAGQDFFNETIELKQRLSKKSAQEREQFAAAGLQIWTELHYSEKKFPYMLATIVIDLSPKKYAMTLAEMLLWDEVLCTDDSSFSGTILKRLAVIGDGSLVPIVFMAKTTNYRYFVDTINAGKYEDATRKFAAFECSQKQFENLLMLFKPATAVMPRQLT